MTLPSSLKPKRSLELDRVTNTSDQDKVNAGPIKDALSGKLDKGGGTLTGGLAAPYILTASAGTGRVSLNPGSATVTGFIGFESQDGYQQGYIGVGDGNSISLAATGNQYYNFIGNAVPKIFGNDIYHRGNLDLNIKMDKAGGVFTGYVGLAPNTGPIVQNGFAGNQFEIQSDLNNGDAFIGFHRRGNYAVRFGLNSLNEFGFGGYSENRFYKLWTEKNFNPSSYALKENPSFTNSINVTANYPVMYLIDNKPETVNNDRIGRFGYINGRFEFLRLNASYTALSTPLVIDTNDVARFAQRPTFGINTPWDSGNLDKNNLVTKDNFKDVPYFSKLKSGQPVNALTPLQRSADGLLSLQNWVRTSEWSNVKNDICQVDLSNDIKQALSSGEDISMPSGTYPLSHPLQMIYNKSLIGVSSSSSKFRVLADFDLSAPGVINMHHNAKVQGVCVSFDQKSTRNRGELIQFPPAFDLTLGTGVTMEDILIEKAMIGIKGYSNCGNSYFNHIRVGAFNYGMTIDGPLGWIKMPMFDFWCWGFSGDANLMYIFYDGGCCAVDFGQVESLAVGSLCTFVGNVQIRPGRLAAPAGFGMLFGEIGTLSLDGNGSTLNVTAGYLDIGTMYSTKNGNVASSPDNNATCQGIRQTGGIVTIGNFDCVCNGPVQDVVVTGGMLTISGGVVRSAAPSVAWGLVGSSNNPDFDSNKNYRVYDRFKNAGSVYEVVAVNNAPGAGLGNPNGNPAPTVHAPALVIGGITVSYVGEAGGYMNLGSGLMLSTHDNYPHNRTQPFAVEGAGGILVCRANIPFRPGSSGTAVAFLNPVNPNSRCDPQFGGWTISAPGGATMAQYGVNVPA